MIKIWERNQNLRLPEVKNKRNYLSCTGEGAPSKEGRAGLTS